MDKGLKYWESIKGLFNGVDAAISTASSTLSRQPGDSIESADAAGQMPRGALWRRKKYSEMHDAMFDGEFLSGAHSDADFSKVIDRQLSASSGKDSTQASR